MQKYVFMFVFSKQHNMQIKYNFLKKCIRIIFKNVRLGFKN